MKTGEWINVWLETYEAPNRRPNTIKGYRYALAHLSPAVLEAEIAHLDAIALQREINALSAVFPRQGQILHVALHAALSRAEKLRMIENNPMRLVDKPTHEAAEAEILQPAEAIAYIDAAQQMPAGRLLVLMLCLGLRRNEARGLRNGDLDESGILHIRNQRTRDGDAPLKSRSSRRELPLPEPFRAFFSGDPGAYLVDVSEKSLRTQHRSALRAAGIDKNVTLHGLRHSCATLAVDQGLPLADVQRLLGHKHIALTADLYAAHERQTALKRTTLFIYNHCYHHLEKGARLEIV